MSAVKMVRMNALLKSKASVVHGKRTSGIKMAAKYQNTRADFRKNTPSGRDIS
jgi:hypothetical protein